MDPLGKSIDAVEATLGWAQELRQERDELAGQVLQLREAAQAFVTAWDQCHQLEKTDVALRMTRTALALEAPAALDALVERVREEEREQCAGIAYRYAAEARAKGEGYAVNAMVAGHLARLIMGREDD